MLVIDSCSGGGAERHVADLAGGLVSRGYEVLVGASAPGPLLEEVRAAAAVIRVSGAVAVKRRADDGDARWLRAEVIRFRPDVVHAHLVAGEVAALRAADSVPLVVTEHTEARWQGDRDRRWSGHVYARADVVVDVSSAIACSGTIAWPIDSPGMAVSAPDVTIFGTMIDEIEAVFDTAIERRSGRRIGRMTLPVGASGAGLIAERAPLTDGVF
jgi:hypothetical protein